MVIPMGTEFYVEVMRDARVSGLSLIPGVYEVYLANQELLAQLVIYRLRIFVYRRTWA